MWENIPEPEDVNIKSSCISQRLKVPGGWIVRTMISRDESGAHVDQIFIVDPGHVWRLEK